MKTITTIDEVIKMLESGDYYYYGFRNASEHDMDVISSGRNYLDCSHDWDYANDIMSDEFLNGSCAIEISEQMDSCEVLKRYQHCCKYYIGEGILLVADNRCEYGNDTHEIILGRDGYGADVLAIVTL